MREACETTPNDITLIMHIADPQLSENEDINLQYSVEYRNDVVTLKDGVGYTSRSISKQGITRSFFYHIINYKNTEVILLNRKGFQNFSVSITNHT